MAIYHFSGTLISRSQGRSAVACAAYRAAERLIDDRYGKVHEYSKKKDVVYTEILLPENAPDWMKDREKLWNTVEAIEKRKDAQLAREFNFSLPKEFTLEQNIALAKEFVNSVFISKGMIADLCIHNDKMQDGEFQPHAHVMLTLREVTLDGFGKKVREWNTKENLLLWREKWAQVANHHLALHGYDIRIDHRSFKEQGIDLEPQYKIGPAAAKERLARLEDHLRIAKENGDKILNDPQIALDAITQQHSTFTHQDLARFVNRHSADNEQFQAVYEKVKQHRGIVYLGLDDRKQERFTTKEMLSTETEMIDSSIELSKRQQHSVKGTFCVPTKSLSEEQKLAFDHLVAPGDLKCVVGYAGTGKSYLLGACKEAWEAQGYRVLGGTLSGIAAENLTASSGIESRTLASYLYALEKGEKLLTKQDILVIDEAGMIGSQQMAKVVEETKRSAAKLVLMGDPEQLQAILAGAAFRAISQAVGYVELVDIRRQAIPWQRMATKELALGKTREGLSRYSLHDHLHAFATQLEAREALISLWNDVRVNQPFQTQIMLAYTREEVKHLNQQARQIRHDLGELGKDQLVLTSRGECALAINDRVYFLKNNKAMGVMNGTLGSVEAVSEKEILIFLDSSTPSKNRFVRLNLDDYNHIDHGYAATVHKAQGVTVDRSYLLASTYLDRHATYVAMSRHRQSVDIFWSRQAFINQGALFKTLGRERAKDVSLDYQLGHPLSSVDSPSAASKESLLQAEKLKREARYEEMLRQGALGYEKLQSKKQVLREKMDNRPDFNRFKAEFESKHSLQAKMIQDKARPKVERLASEVEKQILFLEKAVLQSDTPRVEKKKLKDYFSSVSKQLDVMAYLKTHKQELAKKIEVSLKPPQLEKELDKGDWSL